MQNSKEKLRLCIYSRTAFSEACKCEFLPPHTDTYFSLFAVSNASMEKIWAVLFQGTHLSVTYYMELDILNTEILLFWT
jgi:hypothetical protein